MKQEHPQKKEFFDLLHRAIRKDEKVSRGTKKHKRRGGCSDFRVTTTILVEYFDLFF